jgi:hypothetical protein
MNEPIKLVVDVRKHPDMSYAEWCNFESNMLRSAGIPVIGDDIYRVKTGRVTKDYSDQGEWVYTWVPE